MDPSNSPVKIIAQINKASQVHIGEAVSGADDKNESFDEELGSKSSIFVLSIKMADLLRPDLCVVLQRQNLMKYE